ncbi:MAG: hypothetical protein N2C14_32410, partial [Planctomycetales bacterium]
PPSWLSAGGVFPSIRIPAGDSVEKVAYWEQADSDARAASHALLVHHPIGRGRLILCQIPLGLWKNDPRSQMLLANALEFLLTQRANNQVPRASSPS